MRRFLSTANWPFAVKFAVPCLMAFALVIVVEIIAIGAMDTIKSSLHEVVEHKYNASLLLEQSVERLRAANGELYLVQVKQAAGLPQNIDQETKKIADDLDRVSDNLAKFKIEYMAPADAGKIDDVLQNVKVYKKAVSFVGSMLDIDFKATVNFVLPLRGAYESMIGNLSTISNQFLASSQEDALKADQLASIRTKIIYVSSILILLLTGLIMAPVIYSTARSIKTLATATERLADGDTELNLEALARRDELGRLVKALTVFRDNIERVAALKKVSMLYASMNAMLDALKEGLCSFGPDGICSDIYSKACIPLLEGPPVGRHISEVLQLKPDEKTSVGDLLELIYAEKGTLAMSPKELLDMLPRHFHHSKDLSYKAEDQSISLEYRPILNSVGKIQSVLLVATDHSDELAAARLNRERETKVLMAFRILSYRNQFIQFFQTIASFSASPEESYTKNSYEQLKRDVHTYKGIAGIYYLQDIANALHHIESILRNASDVRSVWTSLISAMSELHVAVINTYEEAEKILGLGFDKQGAIRIIPLNLLKRIAGEIRGARHVQDVYDNYVRFVMGEPIHKLLASLGTEIRDLADRYGKRVADCKFEGQNFQIMAESYEALFSTFTHISRNIIAHAVDEPDIRRALGKPPECTVTISTATFTKDGKEWMRLSFADDGGGIDVRRLREKLLSTHNPEVIKRASDHDIMQYIFGGKVSTAENVTQLSGQGVGMNAVKSEVENLGGTIVVESVFQHSTKIIIEVPLLWGS